ncbi:uncharacterized protein TNCV_3097341 [Trichonephila clavipes]|uniref:Uncharacterized protein n=1 Tax=Trichonephila clavipes TaxID=2585209 RepID=A0A8X6SJ56_TRICX|nr:uncharacterized protein TNCV_3097341 [Trichonephila clavipes]
MIHQKRQLGANQLARLCAHEPIADAAIDGSPRRRRIDIADISTPVAADQRAAKCLEEAVLSFTAMHSRCRSSRADITLSRPLPVFRVVRCSSVHCFQARITVELFSCTRAPIVR